MIERVFQDRVDGSNTVILLSHLIDLCETKSLRVRPPPTVDQTRMSAQVPVVDGLGEGDVVEPPMAGFFEFDHPPRWRHLC